jgi:hypothetical protein
VIVLDGLICKMCGETSTLDRRDVVAAAEIVTFVEAHCVHPDVRIEFCDRHDLQSQGSIDRSAPRHAD